MTTTKQWALSHGISDNEAVVPIRDFSEPYARTAEQVAKRAIVLHCVAAVGFGVEADPIVEWLDEQRLWGEVTDKERAFLTKSDRTETERIQAGWRCEAEWTLLWAIGKVESLGLLDRQCDTRRIVDEIMPALGEDVSNFVSSATLRPPSALLAEDDRIYNLHCYARLDRKHGLPIPDDLDWDVLFERHYAFDWLRGAAEWDNVTCDT